MEKFFDLADYLPISFKIPTDEEYISFLWETFEQNYKSCKYQFAFLAYHMLTMSFIYFSIWQIKQAHPDDFAKSLIGFGQKVEKTLLKAVSPFTLSEVGESTVLRFLKLIDFDSSWIGTYGKLVSDRNKVAHANGHVYFSTQREVDIQIRTALRAIKELQSQSRPTIQHCYQKFLLNSLDPEVREFQLTEDQIHEVLIYNHYMSRKDIEICAEFDVSGLLHHNKLAVEDLHNTLCEFYRTTLEDRV